LRTQTERLVKLVVFTTVPYVEQVVDALSDAGAGHFGNYSHCTFQSPGKGTFKPLEGTQPFISTQNEIEQVEEKKIETIVREQDLPNVLQAMTEAHPYEEVAYDLIKLKNKGESLGIGRIGSLKESITLEKFIELVKKNYEVDQLRYVGELNQEVKKVAILGGSGEKYIDAALNAGADVYLTGDMTFHPAQDAKEMGLAIVDPGHYIEKIMKRATKQFIENKYPKLKVFESKVNTEPFMFM